MSWANGRSLIQNGSRSLFFSSGVCVCDKSVGIGDATARRCPGPKEEPINRDRDTKGDGLRVPAMQNDRVRRLGRAFVVAAALALIVLTWVGARDAGQAHRTETRARVQAEVLGKAFAFEEQVRRDLLSVDQTLRILEHEWQ